MTFQYAVTIEWENPEPPDSAIPEQPYQKREQLMADFVGRIITAQMRGATRVRVDPIGPDLYTRPAPGDGRLAQLEPAGELETTRRGGALERPDLIAIDARHQVNIHESPDSHRTRAAMCGDCGEKYALTGDPTENHRRAMLHKAVCPRRAESEAERGRLIQEFQNQPMQMEFRERAAAALAAGADPELLKLTGVSVFGQIERPALPAPEPDLYDGTVPELIEALRAPRRWWQFWRWFEGD